MKRKRSNSCGASVSSLDDSGLSASEHTSGSSSPANTDDIQVCDDEDEASVVPNSFHHHQHDMHASRLHLQHHSNYPHLIPSQHHSHESASIMQFRDSMHQQSLMNLAFSYFNHRSPYQHQMYPLHQFNDIGMMSQTSFQSPTTLTSNMPLQNSHQQPQPIVSAGSLHSPTSSVRSTRSENHSPNSTIDIPTTSPLAASSPNKPVAKKCGFSISAILGDR